MKQTVLNLLRATGAFAPFRMANRDKALILTYHRLVTRAMVAQLQPAHLPSNSIT
jgi:hypothetical protein